MLLAGVFLLLALALPLAAQSPPPTTTDYDDDDDGLIDIRTAAQLDAVRYDPNGNGDATDSAYAAAFGQRDTAAATRMGCPAGKCTGYELRADLSLSGYANWTPLPRYTGFFEGNGHRITNLTIANNTADDAGLFAAVGPLGTVARVGVTGASVSGNAAASQELGILAGENLGAIRFVYVTGTVTQNSSGDGHKTGGLVGHNLNGAASAPSIPPPRSTGRAAAWPTPPAAWWGRTAMPLPPRRASSTAPTPAAP